MKLIRKIKIYHLTGNYEDPKVKKIVEFFEEIFNNLEEYYSDKYPKSNFFKYNDELYFELDLKYGVTRCKYADFWRKFETEFGLNYKEIKWLTHYMLDTHLKRKVPPTGAFGYIFGSKLDTNLKRKVPPTGFIQNKCGAKLDTHLKRKVPPTTTGESNRLEQLGTHLKRKGSKINTMFFEKDGHGGSQSRT